MYDIEFADGTGEVFITARRPHIPRTGEKVFFEGDLGEEIQDEGYNTLWMVVEVMHFINADSDDYKIVVVLDTLPNN